MRLPVQKGSSRKELKATAGKCLLCSRGDVHEPNGFAFVNGGALRKVGTDSATMGADLGGFLSIGFHGAHSSALEQRSAHG
jgi:hypothetical protein